MTMAMSNLVQPSFEVLAVPCLGRRILRTARLCTEQGIAVKTHDCHPVRGGARGIAERRTAHMGPPSAPASEPTWRRTADRDVREAV